MAYQIPEQKLIAKARQEGIVAFCVGIGIVRDNKALVVRRVQGDFLGGYYEIPGGGVEEGESLESTIKGEVREEMGLVVREITGVFEGFDYRDEKSQKTRQFNFLVTVADGDITLAPEEHDHCLWVDQDNLDQITLADEMKHSLYEFVSVPIMTVAV